MKCRVALDRGGYVPGESIIVTAFISNYSNVTIKRTKASLTEVRNAKPKTYNIPVLFNLLFPNWVKVTFTKYLRQKKGLAKPHEISPKRGDQKFQKKYRT